MEVADLRHVTLDPHLKALYDDGWRSVLAVPMTRLGQMVGALVIRRRVPGAFDAETFELLQTFASQSALAIHNARLYRELETSTAELEVASRHKSEFLASMSHELRTPLNAVIGFSEVLLDQMFGQVNSRQAEYLRDIWSSGRHLLELLNDVLDLSKVEAGKMHLEPSTFLVSDAIAQTVMLVRERAQAHAIELIVVVDPDVKDIEADELRFKQVLLNLLSNAVKFTPDGGEVRVHAHCSEQDLTVTVVDTGVGVPTEDRERIFESFQQGERGVAREEGTGLGLSLTRRIVELFGGRLWMESVVDVGSTFGVTIPLRTGSDRHADTGIRTRRPNGHGCCSSTTIVRPWTCWPPIWSRMRSMSSAATRLTRHWRRSVTRRPPPSCSTSGCPGWTGGSSCTAQERLRDRAHPGRAGHHRRRATTRYRAGRLGLPHQAGRPRGPRAFPPRGRCPVLGATNTGGPMNRRTILVVEDNQLNLKLVRDVLQHAGFSVISAPTGEEGVDIATHEPPDLVLMDLQLPGMDGTEALRRLRAHPASSRVPVVAVTAFAMRQDRERARAAGFDGFVEKPISTRELPRQVRGFLEAGHG